MIEFRCPNCNKLLGKIDGVAEIKCLDAELLSEWIIE